MSLSAFENSNSDFSLDVAETGNKPGGGFEKSKSANKFFFSSGLDCTWADPEVEGVLSDWRIANFEDPSGRVPTKVELQ